MNYKTFLMNFLKKTFTSKIIKDANNYMKNEDVIICAESIKDCIKKGNKLQCNEQRAASILLAIDSLDKENSR